MEERKFVAEIKQLWKDLKRMTWKQRLEHLWEYYKWVLGILAGVLLVVGLLITMHKGRQIEPVFAGISVNLNLSEEAQKYLTTDMEEFLVTKENQLVDHMMTIYGDLADPENAEYHFNLALKVLAMVSGFEVDYIMMDQESFNYYVRQDVFSYLDEVLTQEQIDLFEGRVVYLQDEDNIQHPIALDLRDTEFAKASGLKTLYIGFPNNTGREYTASEFLDYLLEWGKDN